MKTLKLSVYNVFYAFNTSDFYIFKSQFYDWNVCYWLQNKTNLVVNCTHTVYIYIMYFSEPYAENNDDVVLNDFGLIYFVVSI